MLASTTALSWSVAAWINRSYTARLNAASTAFVGLEQTKQACLSAVGDSEDHHSRCKCESSHCQFSYTSFLLREFGNSF
jgi:hypothetical protein